MTNQNRPVGIVVVAVLMVIFGLAEMATGFTHNFLGLVSTATANASTYGGAIVGGTALAIFFAIYIGVKWKYFKDGTNQ
jgi:hypothetical protein